MFRLFTMSALRELDRQILKFRELRDSFHALNGGRKPLNPEPHAFFPSVTDL